MDQASGLRRVIKKQQAINISLEEDKAPRARVITVASGKGGVGKSNVSVNLAVYFRKMGKKVVIFDADFGLANVEVIFGVIPKRTLFDVIYSNKTIFEVLTQGPLGIEFLSAGSGVQELLNLNKNQLLYLVNMLKELDKYADVIIIDTGAGVNDIVLNFIIASREVLLVTTPEPTSVTDAYALVKAIRNQAQDSSKNIYLLINRVRNNKEGVEIFNKFAAVTKRFLGISPIKVGFLPEDKNVKKAVIQQKPISLLYPNSPMCRALEVAANNIIANKPFEEEKKGLSEIIKGFFR